MKTIIAKFTLDTDMFKVSNLVKNRMRRTILLIGVGIVVSGATEFAAFAGSPVLTQLPGHVPAAVARLKAQGILSADTNLNLAIGLPLRNREALTNLLQQIYDPSSTNYHHYLTPAEFTDKFGPSEQDYAMAANFARVNGLKITGTHSNRVLLDVSGKVADIQKAFKVTLKTYHHPAENRDFFAPDTEPQVASGLPILHVSGLDNYSIPHPSALHPRPAGQSNAGPMIGSGPFGSYQGSDFRNAYAPGATLTGHGQNVGLLQFDGFYPSDIAAYATQIGLTTNVPNLVVVPIDGGVPTPTPFGNGEVSLDIEMILSMSPGVSNIYVYEAPNPSPWVDLLNRMANDNLAKQLSCSWGGGPPDAAAEQIFQQMALQGQSFFQASGDSDAYTGFISFPSDSPHITVVGGTTLTTGPNAAYASETVWNWGNEYPGQGLDGIGSSGGVSPTYTIPSWQTNINMTTRGGSTTMRNIPDVALTADNVWVIYGGGQTGAFGGTSCAAPLWAGFTALVNQQAASNGDAPAGFINPTVYALAATTNYNNCFRDITTGNNEWSGSPTLFVAVSNYDLCTGLGSPNGTNLINALAPVGGTSNTVTHLSPPPPPYGSTLSNLNGKNPNGSWQLFVLDDAPFNAGIISNGWILNLTTANPVGASADVALGMAVSSGTASVSNSVVFTLTVTNYGPSISSNVIVSDTLPVGAILIPGTADQGTLNHSGLSLDWNVGNLGTNAGSRAVFTLRFNSAGTYQDYASVSADTPDANPADDFVSTNIVVSIQSPPQLSAALAGGKFQMSVGNNGGATVIIQASTNLLTWVPIFTNTAPFTFTNFDNTNFSKRFYRALISQ